MGNVVAVPGQISSPLVAVDILCRVPKPASKFAFPVERSSLKFTSIPPSGKSPTIEAIIIPPYYKLRLNNLKYKNLLRPYFYRYEYYVKYFYL